MTVAAVEGDNADAVHAHFGVVRRVGAVGPSRWASVALDAAGVDELDPLLLLRLQRVDDRKHRSPPDREIRHGQVECRGRLRQAPEVVFECLRLAVANADGLEHTVAAGHTQIENAHLRGCGVDERKQRCTFGVGFGIQ